MKQIFNLQFSICLVLMVCLSGCALMKSISPIKVNEIVKDQYEFENNGIVVKVYKMIDFAGPHYYKISLHKRYKFRKKLIGEKRFSIGQYEKGEVEITATKNKNVYLIDLKNKTVLKK